jgi:hypothetical protein
MMEATLLQFLDKVFGNPSIMEGTSSKTITTLDDLVSTDLDEVDGLSVTRLCPRALTRSKSRRGLVSTK